MANSHEWWHCKAQGVLICGPGFDFEAIAQISDDKLIVRLGTDPDHPVVEIPLRLLSDLLRKQASPADSAASDLAPESSHGDAMCDEDEFANYPVMNAPLSSIIPAFGLGVHFDKTRLPLMFELSVPESIIRTVKDELKDMCPFEDTPPERERLMARVHSVLTALANKRHLIRDPLKPSKWLDARDGLFTA